MTDNNDEYRRIAEERVMIAEERIRVAEELMEESMRATEERMRVAEESVMIAEQRIRMMRRELITLLEGSIDHPGFTEHFITLSKDGVVELLAYYLSMYPIISWRVASELMKRVDCDDVLRVIDESYESNSVGTSRLNYLKNGDV